MRICQVMPAGEEKLVGYGDEVKVGRIVQAREWPSKLLVNV